MAVPGAGAIKNSIALLALVRGFRVVVAVRFHVAIVRGSVYVNFLANVAGIRAPRGRVVDLAMSPVLVLVREQFAAQLAFYVKLRVVVALVQFEVRLVLVRSAAQVARELFLRVLVRFYVVAQTPMFDGPPTNRALPQVLIVIVLVVQKERFAREPFIARQTF